MSSGRDHDKATKRWAIPFALALAVFFNLRCGIVGGTAFLLGGYFLSPDLDTNSNAFKRWGLIKLIWLPYKKVFKHRSFFSHGPFIGTTIRLLYLLGVISFFLFAINSFEIALILRIWNEFKLKGLEYPKEFISILAGLEGSALLHIIKDGDPLFWRK